MALSRGSFGLAGGAFPSPVVRRSRGDARQRAGALCSCGARSRNRGLTRPAVSWWPGEESHRRPSDDQAMTSRPEVCAQGRCRPLTCGFVRWVLVVRWAISAPRCRRAELSAPTHPWQCHADVEDADGGRLVEAEPRTRSCLVSAAEADARQRRASWLWAAPSIGRARSMAADPDVPVVNEALLDRLGWTPDPIRNREAPRSGRALAFRRRAGTTPSPGASRREARECPERMPRPSPTASVPRSVPQ